MKFYQPDLFDEVAYKVEPSMKNYETELQNLYAKESLLERKYSKIEADLKECKAQIELVKNKLVKENKQCKFVETDLFS